MPIYNYACETCDHRFSVTAKMSDPLEKVCPKCGIEGLKKLVSRTGFRLKGGGWYEQGYSANSNTSSSSTDE